VVSPTFELASVPAIGGVTVTWPRYPGSDFGRYVVLRTVSTTDTADTPTYTPGDPRDVVGEPTNVDETSLTQVFDGRLADTTQRVAYRVAVLDKSGKLVALSSTLTLKLEWSLTGSDTSDGSVPKGSGGVSVSDVAPSTTTTTASSR
jgi:hypothetical protein